MYLRRPARDTDPFDLAFSFLLEIQASVKADIDSNTHIAA